VLSYAHLLHYERALNMADGVLTREVHWETPAGKRVQIETTRVVSFVHRHVAAISYTVTLPDAEAPVALVSEARVPVHTSEQEGDPRKSRGFDERVLLPRMQRCRENRIILGHRTRNSQMTVVCGLDHAVSGEAAYTAESSCSDDEAQTVFQFQARPGMRFTVTKFLTYHTSHTASVEELAERSERTLDRMLDEGWEGLYRSQRRFVTDFWQHADVKIHGDLRVQQSVRWNLFQLLQATARAEGAGVGARGLTGLTYEGHYFWDTEIYVLPFLDYTAPRIARNLLRFRYGMLEQARRRAQQVGESGALFPWRTINGEEASAYYAAGTAQYHINADIAYALRKYVEMSGDREFLHRYGVEMLVETARLWVSLGFFSKSKNSFCINGVTGPDEYNTVVNNNLFTNLMAREHLRYAAAVMDRMKKDAPERYAAVVDLTGFTEEEADTWVQAADAMNLPYHEELGIHLQEDGFLDKQLWDIENTPSDHYPLLLHYHPLVIYRHRVIKQADVVMALFLLGDQFSLEEKRRNFDYYDPLTTGDSSLSVCIQSIVAAEIGYHEEAYEYFRYAVLMDLADIGGNVRDGAHVAAIGGTWMTLLYGFAGMRDYGGRLSFDPRLPVQWQGMDFALQVRGRELRVEIRPQEATYHLVAGAELAVRHQGSRLKLQAGEPVTVPISAKPAGGELHVDALIPRSQFDAVLFDMDGVVTATADVHARAWKQMFDAWLQERAEQKDEPFRPFEIGTDYLLYVDGKPRQDGVHDFLQSRGIQMPAGKPDDSPATESEWGLANRKNELVHEVMRTQGVRAFPGTVRLLHHLRRAGFATALVTSSTNAHMTLEAAGVAELFDERVDGKTAIELKLPGKPAPATYIEAARRVGTDPQRAVVIEDALSGVKAGERGGFGLVIGVARATSAEELLRNGADVTVADLGELLPDSSS